MPQGFILLNYLFLFLGLLDNLIRAGGSQAGDDTHGQGGQGIGGREVRHVDVHGGKE